MLSKVDSGHGGLYSASFSIIFDHITCERFTICNKWSIFSVISSTASFYCIGGHGKKEYRLRSLLTPPTICSPPQMRRRGRGPYFRRGRESATRPCNEDSNKEVVLRNSELLRGSSFELKYIPRFGCRFNEMNQTSGSLLIPSLLLLLLPLLFASMATNSEDEDRMGMRGT